MRLQRNPTVYDAIHWIATNDDVEEMDPNAIARQLSVVMAADLFGVHEAIIAAHIVTIRKALDRTG